jgi:hypothetical protein
MPLAQGDERALLLDVVRKALEDLLAADTGLAVGQEFGDSPPRSRGRLGRVLRSVSAGQQRAVAVDAEGCTPSGPAATTSDRLLKYPCSRLAASWATVLPSMAR